MNPFLLLPLALLFLTACGDKDRARSRAGGDAASAAESLCPTDSGLTAPQAFVCRLYREFPPGAPEDTVEREVTRGFRAFFARNLANRLEDKVTIETALYDSPYQDIADFDIGPYDPELRTVIVQFENHGKQQRLDFILRETGNHWEIQDIRYDPGYALSELVGIPDSTPDPGLFDRYLAVRRGYLRSLAYEGTDREAWEGFSPFRRRVVANERARQARFLNAKIAAITGFPRIDGFEATDLPNNLMNCSSDGCHSLDGVFLFSGQEDQALIVTTRPLLDLATREGVLGRPPSFAEALSYEARFHRMGRIPVEFPEALSDAEVLIGRYGQDDAAGLPATSLVVRAARGDRVYLLLAALEDEEIIPECGQARDAAAYAACHEELLPGQPFYPGVVRQAQEWIDRIAGF